MSNFEPDNPEYAAVVRSSFDKQTFMATLGAELTLIAPGKVAIALPARDGLGQQHGFLHAGVTASILDSACGYSALTLMPEGSEVLSVDFNVSLLRPASGERFEARAEVQKPGKTVSFCRGEAFALTDGGERLIATMTATMIRR